MFRTRALTVTLASLLFAGAALAAPRRATPLAEPWWRVAAWENLRPHVVEVEYTYYRKPKAQPGGFKQITVRTLGTVVDANGLIVVQGDQLAHRFQWRTQDLRVNRDATVRLADGRPVKAAFLGADPEKLMLLFRAADTSALHPLPSAAAVGARAGVPFLAAGLVTGTSEPVLLEGVVSAVLGGEVPRVLFGGMHDSSAIGSPVVDPAGKLLGFVAVYPDPSLRNNERSEETISSPVGTGRGKVDGAVYILPAAWFRHTWQDPARWVQPPEAAGEETGDSVGPVDLPAEDGADGPYLGLQMQPMAPALARYWGLQDRTGGVVTVGTQAGGPAEQAGFRVGDVILAVGGKAVPVRAQNDMTRFTDMIQSYTPGAEVELEVFRPGATSGSPGTFLRPRVKLVARPMTMEVAPLTWIEDAGLTLRPLTTDVRDMLLLRDVEGTPPIVDQVDSGGWGAWAGLQGGDALLEMDHEKLATPEQVRERLEASAKANRKAVLLLVRRGHAHQLVALRTGTTPPPEMPPATAAEDAAPAGAPQE